MMLMTAPRFISMAPTIHFISSSIKPSSQSTELIPDFELKHKGSGIYHHILPPTLSSCINNK